MWKVSAKYHLDLSSFLMNYRHSDTFLNGPFNIVLSVLACFNPQQALTPGVYIWYGSVRSWQRVGNPSSVCAGRQITKV